MRKGFIKCLLIALSVLVILSGVLSLSYATEDEGVKPQFIDANTGNGYSEVDEFIEKIGSEISVEDIYKRVPGTDKYVGVLDDYYAKREAIISFVRSKGVDFSASTSAQDVYRVISENIEEFKKIIKDAYEKVVEQKNVSYDTLKKMAENSDESGAIKLKNPEEVIQFVDPVFEKEVRKLYQLGDRDIRWKDIGYRKVLEIFGVEGKIKTLEDLKWFLNLEEIKMNGTFVSGDLSALDGLKKLKYLSFYGSGITGDIEVLKSFDYLERISLGMSKVTGDLSSLSDLEKLKFISLEETEVFGNISALENLEQLERVYLGVTNVEGDIDSLKNLSKLTVIQLGDTKIHGDLSCISGLKKLKDISFYSTQVGGELRNLSTLYFLERIHLGNTEVIGDIGSLSELNKLKEIAIYGVQVSGDLLTLQELRKLEYLNVEKTNIKGSLRLPDGTVVKGPKPCG